MVLQKSTRFLGSTTNEERVDFLRHFSDVQWWDWRVVAYGIQRRVKRRLTLPGSKLQLDTPASDAQMAFQGSGRVFAARATVRIESLDIGEMPSKIQSEERQDALRRLSTRPVRLQAVNPRFYAAHFICR